MHHHLVPGTGAIDFAAVVAAIRRTGYDGWLTVELYPFIDDPDAAARTALERVAPADRADSRELAPPAQCAENHALPPTDPAAQRLDRRGRQPGGLAARGRLARRAGRWLPLVGASMVLYASGTALNDVFDFEIDRAERPGRPLPSGRVSIRSAAWFGGLGLLLGPALALIERLRCPRRSWPPSWPACILAYDAGMKHTSLGPVFMGACRGLNLLLGMAHAPELGGADRLVRGRRLWPVRRRDHRDQPLGDHEGDRRGLMAGLIVQDLALLGLAAAAMAHHRFPYPAPDRPLIPLEGILVIALIAMVVNQAAAAALEAADLAIDPADRQDRHPQPRLDRCRPGRRGARDRAGRDRRGALGTGLSPGPMVVLHLRAAGIARRRLTY